MRASCHLSAFCSAWRAWGAILPFNAVQIQHYTDPTPRQQKAIREAAAIAVAQQRKMATAAEAVALAKLKEKGMQFDPLPAETRVALRRATARVIDDERKRFGAELVDKILVAGKMGAGKGDNR
jgi:TRAP-type C4-dicarboxylate transport system substrate-binding protein